MKVATLPKHTLPGLVLLGVVITLPPDTQAQDFANIPLGLTAKEIVERQYKAVFSGG